MPSTWRPFSENLQGYIWRRLLDDHFGKGLLFTPDGTANPTRPHSNRSSKTMAWSPPKPFFVDDALINVEGAIAVRVVAMGISSRGMTIPGYLYLISNRYNPGLGRRGRIRFLGEAPEGVGFFAWHFAGRGIRWKGSPPSIHTWSRILFLNCSLEGPWVDLRTGNRKLNRTGVKPGRRRSQEKYFR